MCVASHASYDSCILNHLQWAYRLDIRNRMYFITCHLSKSLLIKLHEGQIKKLIHKFNPNIVYFFLSQSCGTKHGTQATNLGNVIRMKELRHAICNLFNKKSWNGSSNQYISKPMSRFSGVCYLRNYLGIRTVTSGAPNDSFLLNALKGRFKLSRVLLDV